MILRLATLVALVVTAGCAEDVPPAAALMRAFDASRVTLFQVSPERTPASEWHDEKRVQGWLVRNEKEIASLAQVERIQRLLRAADSYSGRDMACYDPGMALRLERDGESIDVVVCLECRWAYFFGPEEKFLKEPITGALTKELAALFNEEFGYWQPSAYGDDVVKW